MMVNGEGSNLGSDRFRERQSMYDGFVCQFRTIGRDQIWRYVGLFLFVRWSFDLKYAACDVRDL
jgi:hypothetical protein